MVDFAKIRADNAARIAANKEALANSQPQQDSSFYEYNNGDEALDHTPLTFGKYKGKTPNYVAENEGQTGVDWIKWAYENVTNRPVCSLLLAKECGYRVPVSAAQAKAIIRNEQQKPSYYDDYEDDIPF